MKASKATRTLTHKRPFSRKLLQQMLTDLEQRTAQQALVAESLVTLVEPNDQMPREELMIRVAIGQAIESHAQGMRALSGFAKIVCEDRTVQS